jgi:hypothetical protein
MKMTRITRLWDIYDFILQKDNVEKFSKRPRIDYRISKYIFDYINESILKPKKIIQTGNI